MTKPVKKTSTKKGIRLTSVEKKYIEDAVIAGKTDEYIAGQINRNILTIKRYRDSVGFKKTGGGSLKIDADIVSKGNKEQTDANETEAEKLKAWTYYFKTTPRYKRLIEELIPADLDYFVHQWANYHAQMEDMKPAEEDTLELLITYQIRLRHNRRNYKALQEQEEIYKQQLGGALNLELDLEDERSRWVWEALISNNKAMQELNKEFKDFTDKHDNLVKSLNITRQQREDQQKIGAETFLSLIKKLNNKEEREEVGKYNERMRFSTESQIKKLKEPYEFIDGTVEPIYLDGDDFKGDKK